MTRLSPWRALAANETVNFLLTNRLPRRTATRFMGWFSRIRCAPVTAASIALWRAFTDLDLSDARESHFASLHECFTRRLRDGARAIDPDPSSLVSPCDAILGAHGYVEAGTVLQAKGSDYAVADLMVDPLLAGAHEGCAYVTLRLTSAMYHHFHAPADLLVERVTYVSGDAWNVNPVALKRVARLFCRNERAVVQTRLADGSRLTLVPVAAILVASLRFTFSDLHLHLRYRGPTIRDYQVAMNRGEEMGWFEHGSTIILFAPPGWRLAPELRTGAPIRMGQALLRQGR